MEIQDTVMQIGVEMEQKKEQKNQVYRERQAISVSYIAFAL